MDITEGGKVPEALFQPMTRVRSAYDLITFSAFLPKMNRLPI
jgi:hypothetical protein